MEHLATPKRRESSDGTDDSDLDAPPDVAGAYGISPLIDPISPTHETGHTTPGHVVGRPIIYESPTHAYFPSDANGTNNQGLQQPGNLMNVGVFVMYHETSGWDNTSFWIL